MKIRTLHAFAFILIISLSGCSKEIKPDSPSDDSKDYASEIAALQDEIQLLKQELAKLLDVVNNLPNQEAEYKEIDGLLFEKMAVLHPSESLTTNQRAVLSHPKEHLTARDACQWYGKTTRCQAFHPTRSFGERLNTHTMAKKSQRLKEPTSLG